MDPKEVYMSQVKTYRTKGYTVFNVPLTGTLPTGTGVTYDVISPTEAVIEIDSTQLSVKVSREYDLDETFDFKFYAKVNSTLYTTHYYQVTVECSSECEY